MRKLLFLAFAGLAVVLYLERNAVLLRGVRYGQTGLMNVALLFRADKNVYDADGNTPLLVAVQRNQSAAVDRLIRAGADVNLKNRDTGLTPLMLAADRGDAAFVDALLRAGATNEKDNEGSTARAHAWNNNHLELAQKLRNVPEPPNAAPAAKPSSLVSGLALPPQTAVDTAATLLQQTPEQIEKQKQITEASKRFYEEQQKKIDALNQARENAAPKRTTTSTRP